MWVLVAKVSLLGWCWVEYLGLAEGGQGVVDESVDALGAEVEVAPASSASRGSRVAYWESTRLAVYMKCSGRLGDAAGGLRRLGPAGGPSQRGEPRCAGGLGSSRFSAEPATTAPSWSHSSASSDRCSQGACGRRRPVGWPTSIFATLAASEWKASPSRKGTATRWLATCLAEGGLADSHNSHHLRPRADVRQSLSSSSSKERGPRCPIRPGCAPLNTILQHPLCSQVT